MTRTLRVVTVALVGLLAACSGDTADRGAAATGSSRASASVSTPAPSGTTASTPQPSSGASTVAEPSPVPTPAPSGESQTAEPTPTPTSPTPAPPPSSQTLGATIVDFDFAPDPIEVSVGDSVRWTNQDSTTHTVSLRDGSIDSGAIAGGDGFTATFATAGTFEYYCKFHPGSMVATVVVR